MKKLKLGIAVIALLSIVFSGCTSNGKTYEIDKNHHVYYKGDGVNEDEAKKTGDYLKELGLVQSTAGMDVQIKADKPADDVKFSLVFDKTKITPEAEASALAMGAELSNRVFNGRKVIVAFADDQLNEIKNLGAATPAQQQTQQQGDQNNTNQTGDQK